MLAPDVFVVLGYTPACSLLSLCCDSLVAPLLPCSRSFCLSALLAYAWANSICLICSCLMTSGASAAMCTASPLTDIALASACSSARACSMVADVDRGEATSGSEGWGEGTLDTDRDDAFDPAPAPSPDSAEPKDPLPDADPDADPELDADPPSEEPRSLSATDEGEDTLLKDRGRGVDGSRYTDEGDKTEQGKDNNDKQMRFECETASFR